MNKLLTVFFSLILLSSPSLQAQEVELDRIAAIVSNDVVTEVQVQNLISKVARNAEKTGKPLANPESMREQVIERLILESLQLQLADRMGLQISDSQLQSTIDNILAAENKTQAQLLKELEEDGSNYRQFREEVRTEVLLGELSRSQVRRRITISETEVEALAKLIEAEGRNNIRYHVGHILLRDNKAKDTDSLAQDLVSQLKAGADFQELASLYSQGPKALEGGDWGWMSVEEMPTIFSSVVANQHANSILGPFRSNSGLHIIKVLGTEGLEKVEIKEVNARHILIKPSIILSDRKAESLLLELRQRILDKKDSFADLAREYSEDPGTAVRGGELGWADPSSYVPEFRDTALQIETGEISQPFRSSFGWHLLEVTERRSIDATDDVSKNRAQQILMNRKFAEETQAWLEELRESAYIEIMDPAS